MKHSKLFRYLFEFRFKCPYCGKFGFSLWEKIAEDYGGGIKCRVCKQKCTNRGLVHLLVFVFLVIVVIVLMGLFPNLIFKDISAICYTYACNYYIGYLFVTFVF